MFHPNLFEILSVQLVSNNPDMSNEEAFKRAESFVQDYYAYEDNKSVRLKEECKKVEEEAQKAYLELLAGDSELLGIEADISNLLDLFAEKNGYIKDYHAKSRWEGIKLPDNLKDLYSDAYDAYHTIMENHRSRIRDYKKLISDKFKYRNQYNELVCISHSLLVDYYMEKLR